MGDIEFLQSVNEHLVSLHFKNTAHIENVDFSGITIGGNLSLIENPSLYKSILRNVNLSYSIIDADAQKSEWDFVDFTKAKLNRCALHKSKMKDCNFQEARLIIMADDAVFDNCNFTKTHFKGVEFRASRFFNCNFTDTKFINCDFRGVKMEDGILPVASQFEKMDVPEYLII